jgi:hypothetical protein
MDMYTDTTGASSAIYNFRKDFRAIARPAFSQFSDEPYWSSEYLYGLRNQLRGEQSLAAFGEPWDLTRALAIAEAFTADLAEARRQYEARTPEEIEADLERSKRPKASPEYLAMLDRLAPKLQKLRDAAIQRLAAVAQPKPEAKPEAKTEAPKQEVKAEAPRREQRSTTKKQPPKFGAGIEQLSLDETLEARDWLFDRHYVRGYATATIAHPKVGKTLKAVLDALAMATGRRDIAQGVPVKAAIARGERCCVLYVNGEDPAEEVKLRFQAAAKLYGVSQSEIEGWLFIGSGRRNDFVVAKDDNGKFAYAEPVVAALTGVLKELRIDVLIVDPLVKFHRVPENDNNKIDAVITLFNEIADQCKISIELVCHARKTNGERVTADDWRGGGAQFGAVRGLRAINVMTEEEGKTARLEPGEHAWLFRIDDGGSNMVAPGAAGKWYRKVSIDLPVRDPKTGKPTTESVAAIESWSWPAKEDAKAVLADIVAEAAEPVRALNEADLAVLALIEKRILTHKPVVYGRVSPNSAPKLFAKGVQGGRQKERRFNAVEDSVDALIAHGKLHIEDNSTAHQKALALGPRLDPRVHNPNAPRPWKKRAE